MQVSCISTSKLKTIKSSAMNKRMKAFVEEQEKQAWDEVRAVAEEILQELSRLEDKTEEMIIINFAGTYKCSPQKESVINEIKKRLKRTRTNGGGLSIDGDPWIKKCIYKRVDS